MEKTEQGELILKDEHHEGYGYVFMPEGRSDTWLAPPGGGVFSEEEAVEASAELARKAGIGKFRKVRVHISYHYRLLAEPEPEAPKSLLVTP